VGETSRDIGAVGSGARDGPAAGSRPANVCNDLARAPADYFPNRLLDPVPRVPLPRRGALLAVLVLFCLAMQLWMASRWHIIWPDTVDYLRVSRALDGGDPKPLAEQFGPNLYPLILVLLHRAGANWLWASQSWRSAAWLQAAQGWSIALTCLAVLPLFGWLRRQFDDQVALVGCLLYALHPKLMTLGSLIIRDATFWFLLTLTLYLGWRAVLELKPWLFCAAGVAWALAVHTRTEGLLLAAPLGLWWILRWPAAAGYRRRLVLGGLLAAAMLPAWLLLMNLTLLHDYPRWMLIRRDHVEMLDSPAESGAPPPAGSTLRIACATVPRVGVRIVKAFTYAYGFLVLLGLWLWRRVCCRRDQLAMLPLHLVLWFLIGVRLAEGMESDDRYYLPSVIVTTGYAALALLAIAQRLVRWTASRVAWSPPRRAALVFGLLAAFVLIGTHDRSLGKRWFMVQRAELGQWILDRFGPHRRVAGGLREMRLVVYYAQAEEAPPFECDLHRREDLLQTIGRCRPDVLLLWGWDKDLETPRMWRKLLDEHAELGLRPVPKNELPPSCREVDVFLAAVRKELLEGPPPASSHAARR
jgi:hypothetical protein